MTSFRAGGGLPRLHADRVQPPPPACAPTPRKADRRRPRATGPLLGDPPTRRRRRSTRGRRARCCRSEESSDGHGLGGEAAVGEGHARTGAPGRSTRPDLPEDQQRMGDVLDRHGTHRPVELPVPEGERGSRFRSWTTWLVRCGFSAISSAFSPRPTTWPARKAVREVAAPATHQIEKTAARGQDLGVETPQRGDGAVVDVDDLAGEQRRTRRPAPRRRARRRPAGTGRLPSPGRPSRWVGGSTTRGPTRGPRPAGSGTRRTSDRHVTDLPEPDSPTRASVSPASRVKLTPSTALVTPRRVKK